ncbi:MAG TPA: extracellular solute-binding protein, partial [Rhodocyclaceae bacterium]|nr:extracellular solute-binding protein [Rhodocyclaceae bacterium]
MARLALSLILVLAWSVADAQELVLRHAVQGRALDSLSTLVLKFNDEQKGKGRVVLEDLAAVSDKHRLPHLALLDPDDRGQFFDTLPRFKPLYEVMKEGGIKFDGGQFFPQMVDAVDDLSGKMQGLPVAMAVPVLFYNKDAFRKAGLDPEVPPKTWWEVQKVAGALFDAGYKCPLTTSRFAWMHVENVSSQHGEPMLAKAGKSERVILNQLVNVKHIALLASWQKSRYFHYFGPGREGDQKFLGGDCAMLTGESSLYADLLARPAFATGIAAMPYYDDVRDAKPMDVLPDGASLWILPGKKKDEYKLAARFVAFLLKPEVQREWVQATGFLPMTRTSVEALRQEGAPSAVLDAVEKRLSMPRQGLARTKTGFGRSRVREILDEEIEFVWHNRKPAKEALDTAMAR